MKSHCDSIMGKLLILIIGIFLAVTLLGCHDPIVTDMEAEHRQLGDVCKRELRHRQDLSVFRQGLSAFPSSSQAEVFHPAP